MGPESGQDTGCRECSPPSTSSAMMDHSFAASAPPQADAAPSRMRAPELALPRRSSLSLNPVAGDAQGWSRWHRAPRAKQPGSRLLGEELGWGILSAPSEVAILPRVSLFPAHLGPWHLLSTESHLEAGHPHFSDSRRLKLQSWLFPQLPGGRNWKPTPS